MKCLLSLKATINNVEYGVIVKKVHTILSFNQSAWMKPYRLDKNDLRTNAKHDFEKDFLNLMNNLAVGKTMERVKTRFDLILTADPKMAIKQFPMLTFKTAKYLEGLYMIETYETKVVVSKPIYVGCAILDLAKLSMLDVHYTVIEKHFKHKYTVPWGDTDSFVYTSKHPDMYEWRKEHCQYFDLSDYTRADMHSNEHKKKLGCFKDEIKWLCDVRSVRIKA